MRMPAGRFTLFVGGGRDTGEEGRDMVWYANRASWKVLALVLVLAIKKLLATLWHKIKAKCCKTIAK